MVAGLSIPFFWFASRSAKYIPLTRPFERGVVFGFGSTFELEYFLRPTTWRADEALDVLEQLLQANKIARTVPINEIGSLDFPKPPGRKSPIDRHWHKAAQLLALGRFLADPKALYRVR
jgi:hypothetical protein